MVKVDVREQLSTNAFMFLHRHDFLGKRYLKAELKGDGHVSLNTEASGEMELLTVSALELAGCVL